MVVLQTENGKLKQIYYSKQDEHNDNEIILSSSDVMKIFRCEMAKGRRKIMIHDIDRMMEIIETIFEVKSGKLMSKTRKANYVIGRYTGMYILFKNAYGSLTTIGNIFKLNHATVIHGIKVIENLLATSNMYKTKIKKTIEVYEGELLGNSYEEI